jgi:hypothetical protein
MKEGISNSRFDLPENLGLRGRSWVLPNSEEMECLKEAYQILWKIVLYTNLILHSFSDHKVYNLLLD